ncbi:MAG: hypothetical protein JSW58_05305 [Candidatus Latescibacterota bacterium]|nr:MAG: hypothetical protein JSW58_05305 [Candidatus Latescibacterota bacterium]
MRKCFLALGLAIISITFVFGVANAQFPSPHPFYAVYFDDTYQTEAYPVAPDPCPGVLVIDTLYVMLVNANAWVLATEFSVSYPPAISWITDLDKWPTNIGNTPTGLSQGRDTPLNGFAGAVECCKVLVQWMCDACDPAYINNEIVVDKHPASVRDYPSYVDLFFVEHEAIGLTSLICATIPTEDTTWGRVKALYTR